MADGAPDATLELTLLAADGLNYFNFLGKSGPFAVAWVDPCIKKSTKGLLTPSRGSPSEPKLHLPLSLRALRNPASCLTVQIVSPRLPFRAAKPIASAVLPLSSVRLGGETLTLPLRRPSGRTHCSLRMSLRILWFLGAAQAVDCVAGPPTPTFVPAEADMHCLLPVHPTAPSMLDGKGAESEVLVEVIDPTDSPMPDGYSAISRDLAVPIVSEVVKGRNLVPVSPTAPAMPSGRSAWRSFLIGLLSGTVAAVLVGAAKLSEF